jgi:hypothetical protein
VHLRRAAQGRVGVAPRVIWTDGWILYLDRQVDSSVDITNMHIYCYSELLNVAWAEHEFCAEGLQEVCVCVCVYAWECVCVGMSVCGCVCARACSVSVYVCACVRTNTRARARVCVCA